MRAVNENEPKRVMTISVLTVIDVSVTAMLQSSEDLLI